MALGTYAVKYTQRLDRIIERETLTSDLNMNNDLLGEFNEAGEIKVATIAMDGLANYTRADGFVAGTVTTDWETYKLRYDRGREFEVDAMDDEERAALLSANLMAEFERTQVVPEVDAVRFATLATNAGTNAYGALADADAALDALLAGEQTVQDLGVDLSTCILYCTSKVKNLLRKAQNYRLGQGENPNGNFATFDEMKLVTVPSARFVSAVDLNDGKTSGQEAGGFKKNASAVDLDFMIVHPSACAALQRHRTLRYFAPETNQHADAHLWQMRLFHDLLVYEKQKGKIYVHTPTAIAGDDD